MVHPCNKSCGNKTANGYYCATTDCINPLYSNIGTAQYGQGVQKRIITNADKIRAMTDEELAEWIFRSQMQVFKVLCDAICNNEYDEKEMERWDDILSWLKQEEE